jgi:hypothetical protein
VRWAPLLVSTSRFVGRRFAAGAVTLALALSLPLGAVAVAAPVPPPPPPPAPAAKASPPAAKSEPADAKKEPAPALTVLLPLEVSGSLSKDSRRTLANRLQAATAAAKVAGGPYRARLSLRVSKKKDYAITLTVLGADDATLASPTDQCKACSIAQVGDRIDALVKQATEGLAPKEPPPPVAASVSVRTEPLGARVVVDGAELGLTPQAIELPPGEHTVAVDKPGFVAQQKTITVEPGTPQELVITLAAAPPAGKGKRGRAKAKDKDQGPSTSTTAGRGLKIGGAVMLGLGVAGVATGVAMILIDEDPIPSRCSGTDVDFRGVCRYRYDTLLGGIVGVAAGAVGIGGGLAMMIKGRQLAVRARASKQAASLSLTLRF